jgi:prolipoprotein diacylglyceryltransferase
MWNAARHPAQIYELIAALLIFGWIWSRKADSPPGVLFLTCAASTAAARLFLEAFRGDSTLIFGGLRLAQILAWIALAVAFFAGETIRREKTVN